MYKNTTIKNSTWKRSVRKLPMLSYCMAVQPLARSMEMEKEQLRANMEVYINQLFNIPKNILANIKEVPRTKEVTPVKKGFTDETIPK